MRPTSVVAHLLSERERESYPGFVAWLEFDFDRTVSGIIYHRRYLHRVGMSDLLVVPFGALYQSS